MTTREEHTVRTAIEQSMPITEVGTQRPSRHDAADDIEGLAASMAVEGLRNPVLLTPAGDVLKGSRRIAAAQHLGWTSIQARPVMTMEEAAERIIAQRDETSRPRTVSEVVALGMAMELLDRRDRKPEPYALIGPAVTTSGSTYKRARALVVAAHSQHRPAHVVAVAQEALARVDAGELLVTTAHERMRAAERADPVDCLGPDGLPIIPPPLGSARSPKARRLRIDWIRALAAKGASSAQIAERLNISTNGLRKIVNDVGITVPADVVLSRTQRKAADPNRAVRVAVSDLDALVWSLDRIDTAALDPIEASVWATQLKEYARSIERVSRKIAKEHVR